MDASSAINTVRQRRPNSIQTRGQIACIQEFAQFLRPLRIVFPQVAPHAERLTLTQFLHRQRHLLHGFESRELRHTPKIVHVVCQRLIDIATTSESDLYVYRSRANTGPKPRSAKRKGQLRRSNTVATIKETLPGAFLNERVDLLENKLEHESSQEVNALLSPRLSRRVDSAGFKTSTSPKSRSGPSSPAPTLRKMSSSANGASPGENNSPIVVSDVKHSPPSAPVDEQANPDLVGPQVVLVKQGSRTGLLQAATNITQAETESNLNNNNQILETNVKVNTPSTRTHDSLPKSRPRSPNDAVIDTKPQDITPPSNKSYSLPSPTPSIHEPLRNRESKKSGPSDTVQRSTENKPPTQNYRSSAGRAQRVLPTGLPLRNRAGSGKGRKIELFADEPEDEESTDDNNKKPGEEKEPPQDEEEGESPQHEEKEKPPQHEEKEEPQNEEESEIVDDDKSSSQDKIKEGEKPQSQDAELVPADDHTEQEDLDKELDEIIEINQDEGPFLSESENEGEEDLGRSGDGSLSHSMASRVSWTEQLNRGDKEKDLELNVMKSNEKDDENDKILQSAEFASPPPTTFSQDTGIEKSSEHVSEKSESSPGDSHEDEDLKLFVPGQSSAEVDSNLQTAEHDTEGNKKLQKPLGLPLRNLTRSLGDLRRYEGEDVLVSMSDMTEEFSVPVSPVSKSSSSDDVRTPIGSASKKRIKDPITVAMALAYKLTDNEWLWEKVYSKQVELNTREGAWSGFDQEGDAHLLTCLMWSWIEHLSKPVLSEDDINKLIQMSRAETDLSSEAECPDPALFEEGLSALGKNICSTFQCILRCLLSLPPLSFELETSVIRRVISALSHLHFPDIIDEENDSLCRKLQDLEFVVRNYLLKTRIKEKKLKKSPDSLSTDNDVTAISSAESLSDKENLKNSNQRDFEEKEADATANEEILYKEDSDTSSQASSVSELPPRITVS